MTCSRRNFLKKAVGGTLAGLVEHHSMKLEALSWECMTPLG